MQWLAVAAGGALGALGRYGLNGLVYHYSSLRFPLGTLLANVIGSALMGAMFVLIIERGILPPIWREFAMIGGAGRIHHVFYLLARHPYPVAQWPAFNSAGLRAGKRHAVFAVYPGNHRAYPDDLLGVKIKLKG